MQCLYSGWLLLLCCSWLQMHFCCSGQWFVYLMAWIYLHTLTLLCMFTSNFANLHSSKRTAGPADWSLMLDSDSWLLDGGEVGCLHSRLAVSVVVNAIVSLSSLSHSHVHCQAATERCLHGVLPAQCTQARTLTAWLLTLSPALHTLSHPGDTRENGHHSQHCHQTLRKLQRSTKV